MELRQFMRRSTINEIVQNIKYAPKCNPKAAIIRTLGEGVGDDIIKKKLKINNIAFKKNKK